MVSGMPSAIWGDRPRARITNLTRFCCKFSTFIMSADPMGTLRKHPLTGMNRFAAAALAGACLLPLAACSKTSDGTVIMPKPPAISSLVPVQSFVPAWARSRRQPEPYAVAVAETDFPEAPPASTPPRRIKPVMVRRDSAGKLACHNQTASNGRVRVICK